MLMSIKTTTVHEKSMESMKEENDSVSLLFAENTDDYLCKKLSTHFHYTESCSCRFEKTKLCIIEKIINMLLIFVECIYKSRPRTIILFIAMFDLVICPNVKLNKSKKTKAGGSRVSLTEFFENQPSMFSSDIEDPERKNLSIVESESRVFNNKADEIHMVKNTSKRSDLDSTVKEKSSGSSNLLEKNLTDNYEKFFEETRTVQKKESRPSTSSMAATENAVEKGHNGGHDELQDNSLKNEDKKSHFDANLDLEYRKKLYSSIFTNLPFTIDSSVKLLYFQSTEDSSLQTPIDYDRIYPEINTESKNICYVLCNCNNNNSTIGGVTTREQQKGNEVTISINESQKFCRDSIILTYNIGLNEPLKLYTYCIGTLCAENKPVGFFYLIESVESEEILRKNGSFATEKYTILFLNDKGDIASINMHRIFDSKTKKFFSLYFHYCLNRKKNSIFNEERQDSFTKIIFRKCNDKNFKNYIYNLKLLQNDDSEKYKVYSAVYGGKPIQEKDHPLANMFNVKLYQYRYNAYAWVLDFMFMPV